MRCKSDAVVLNSSATNKTETTRIFFCLNFAYAQARICGSSQNEVSKTYPKLDLIFCSSGIHNSKASWAVHCLSMHPDRFEVESRAMNRRTLYGWTKATKVSVSSETRVIHSPLSRTHNRSQLWSWRRAAPGAHGSRRKWPQITILYKIKNSYFGERRSTFLTVSQCIY